MRWKACKATFDWGIREGMTAGTQVSCDADNRDCLAGLVRGELDENDPLAIKCNDKYRKCLMGAAKKR